MLDAGDYSKLPSLREPYGRHSGLSLQELLKAAEFGRLRDRVTLRNGRKLRMIFAKDSKMGRGMRYLPGARVGGVGFGRDH